MSAVRLAALLRGVNVGGRGHLAMADLARIVEGLGHAHVRTVLQSGNVVFEPAGNDIDALARELADELARELGLQVRVVMRDHADLCSALARSPFREVTDSGSRAHLIFLDGLPDQVAVALLDADRSPPDRFQVDGREIHVHFPGGAGRSKLTLDWFERQLGVTGTMRNLNTVRRLVELTATGRSSAVSHNA